MRRRTSRRKMQNDEEAQILTQIRGEVEGRLSQGPEGWDDGGE